MRSNFVKGTLCGLMLTIVMGSVAFAKTGNYSQHIGTNKTHVNKCIGSVGNYKAELRGTRTNGDFRVSANSTTTKDKYYSVQAARLGSETSVTKEFHSRAKMLTKNSTENEVIAAIRRVNDEESYDYYGCAITYNSSSVYSGICDDFRWNIYPYTK